MRKSEQKPWWRQVEDGDVPDYSRDHAEIYRERLAEENGEVVAPPPAVLVPSQFSSLPEGDPNHTVDEHPHVDVIREAQRRSESTPVEQLTEKELDAEIAENIPAAPRQQLAAAIPQEPIFSDGTQANAHPDGIQVAGVTFVNPNRNEGQKTYIKGAHEIRQVVS